MRRIAAVFALMFSAAVLGGCGGEDTVIIFHADALTVPMNEIIAKYEEQNPNVRIHAEAHGSVTCANLVKDGRSCDILMVADARIIKMLMLNPIGHTGRRVASESSLQLAYFRQVLQHRNQIMR